MKHHSSAQPRRGSAARLRRGLTRLAGTALAVVMLGTLAPSAQSSLASAAPQAESSLSPTVITPSSEDAEDDNDDDEQDQDTDDAQRDDDQTDDGQTDDDQNGSSTGRDGQDSAEDQIQNEEPEVEFEDSELIMVMDASGSMTAEDAGDTTRIEAARQALHSVVDSLEDRQDVGLRVFAGEITDGDAPEACEDSQLAVEIGSDNRSELTEAIDDYKAIGARTPLAYALEQAAGDLGDEGNRTIVLVSDGEENCAPDPCEAAEAIAEEGIELAIHTVGFQIEDDEAAEAREQLQCIADAGGGQYHDASDAETLTHTLERLSYRAFQPFSLHGDEVEAGSNQDNAPVLEPGSQYVGAFEYETMYYRIARTMENSTLHVGLATYNDEAENWENAEVELTTMGDNRTCGRHRVGWWGSSAANLFRTAQVAATPVYDSEDRDAGCGEDEELLLAIHAGGRHSEGDELLGQPFELIVEEEADPVNGEDFYTDYESNGLPWDSDDLDWIEMDRDRESDETIYAGSSLNNAPQLQPGETYDTDILPGEVQVYQIPAEWHQQIQTEAFFPEPDSTLEDQLRSNYTRVHVDILSPHRGRATSSRGGSGSEIGSGRERISPQEATTLHRYTHPVWWPNRYSTTGSHSEHSTAVDGDYYVVLSADPNEDNHSFSIPYRLTVDTFDVIDAETPDYPEPGTEPTNEADTSPGQEDDDQPDETDPVQEDDGDQTEPAASPEASAEPTVDDQDQNNDDDEAPVAAEQTGFTTTHGMILGLGVLGLLLLAGGGLFLARMMKSSRSSGQ